MSFQQIRSYIETRVAAAFPGITCVFDNTFETPPPVPYVICLISYPTTTMPVLCTSESMVEQLRGNLQISCYAERGEGMGPLEDMAAQGMTCMNNMYDWSDFYTKIRCGQISGPTPVLSGTEPYGLITLSCAFNAEILKEKPLPTPPNPPFILSNEVALTNPTP